MGMVLLSRQLARHVIPEGIGKNKDHGDHETIDGCGLDHCQSHEKRPGNGSGGVRLLGEGRQGGRDCPALPYGRADGAEGNSESRGNDRRDGYKRESVQRIISFFKFLRLSG